MDVRRGRPWKALDRVRSTARRSPFNLSHTDGLVACAVTRETPTSAWTSNVPTASPDSRDIASRYFSAAELTQLDACPEDQRAARFIELWTLKEAYVKAIGRGLGHPLNTFAFSFDETSGLRFDARTDPVGASWTFALFAPSPRHRLALATRVDSTGHGRLVVREANQEIVLAPSRATFL